VRLEPLKISQSWLVRCLRWDGKMVDYLSHNLPSHDHISYLRHLPSGYVLELGWEMTDCCEMISYLIIHHLIHHLIYHLPSFLDWFQNWRSMRSWIARAASYGDLVDVSVRKERDGGWDGKWWDVDERWDYGRFLIHHLTMSIVEMGYHHRLLRIRYKKIIGWKNCGLVDR